MRPWQTAYDPKLDARRHTAVPGFGHALLAPVVAYTFATLRISATLWAQGQEWLPIHAFPNIVRYEMGHGVNARSVYNEQVFARVLEERKVFRGEFGGHSDVFAPILVGQQVLAILVVGPFARSRATSAEVLERWRALTGRQGHPADPEFAAYLAETHRMLVLENDRADDFEKLVGCLAKLMAGQGDAAALANQAEQLRLELEPLRSVDRIWEVVQQAIDDPSPRAWFTANSAHELMRQGLTREPDHVLVGLSVSRDPNMDPVEEAVRRDGFQRSAVALARKVGDVLAGQVGDHGVVFLSAQKGSAQKKRDKVQLLVERAGRLAEREFGFSMHFGASPAPGSDAMNATYQCALGAAESALGRGERFSMAVPGQFGNVASLRQLRAELVEAVNERPDLLGPRFDRYIAAVAVQCAHRMEPAKAYLEIGLEKIVEPLIQTGALEQRSLAAFFAVLDRSARAARGMTELGAAYRKAADELSEAVKKPVAARQDRSLRLALDYIQQHYTEPLRLDDVARVSGFAPGHFSKLFIKRERMPFEKYVRSLRLDRAKHLLVSTSLEATRVAELSGFGSLQYFCRVFKEAAGVTPLEFREASLNVGGRIKRTHRNTKTYTAKSRSLR